MTYVYRCSECGDREVLQSMQDPAFTECALCGKPVYRVIQKTPVHFSGSGYYCTDSPKAKKPL